MQRIKLCAVCKKDITGSRNKYCSYQCNDTAKKARDKKKKWLKQRGVTKPKLDKIWSKKIREVGRCEYCRGTEYLNAHHILSRSNMATRWDLDNGICLCSKHHTFSSTFSAHKTPTEFTLWLIDKKGIDLVDSLGRKARTLNTKDLDEWWEYLNK